MNKELPLSQQGAACKLLNVEERRYRKKFAETPGALVHSASYGCRDPLRKTNVYQRRAGRTRFRPIR